MPDSDVTPYGLPCCGATPPDGIADGDFRAALLREQYRSLARLGPYVYAAVILATVALCAATSRTSPLIDEIPLPAALIAVSVSGLISWLKARPGVERVTLNVARRDVRGAGVLGTALAFTLSLMAATFTSQGGVVEFALALVAVWIAAAACAFCLNVLGAAASVVVAAATMPLIVAFLTRGADMTLWLAAVLTVATCFVIRMLGENFRMFAEIVRSRFAIAEKQRQTEDARRAAMTIALTDDLTGLPNRRCFQGQLAERIRTGTETASPFAVGLIDLDGFKPINDIHGHPVGDDILRQVAVRLAKAMEGRGSAARTGGDEFAILCDGIGARAEAIALGDEIQAIFATPFAVGGLHIALTGACGFALFPSSAAEPDGLVRLADAALYRAKAMGRSGVTVHDATAENDPVGHAATEDVLRRAVAEWKIDVVFQPIFDLKTGRTRGFETLARWDDAARGPIAPSVFIPIAEQVDVIDELSQQLLREGAGTATEWPSDVRLSSTSRAHKLSTPTTDLRNLSR